MVLACLRDNSAEEYDALSEPMCDRRGQPRVLFAGEATTRYHPSTVHGAWLTGLREATRLDSHAKAGYHRKGRRRKRDDTFSPDIMYESSVLFVAQEQGAPARTRVKAAPANTRTRPTKQADGTDCRRSRRLERVDDGEGAQHSDKCRWDEAGDDPARSLRRLPHRLDGEYTETSEVLSKESNDGGDLPQDKQVPRSQWTSKCKLRTQASSECSKQDDRG